MEPVTPSTGPHAEGTVSSAAPGAHVIRSDSEAIGVAMAFASAIAPGASDRDRDGALPYAELEQLGRSGLLGARVPGAYGGADVSNETIAEITRIISAADPAIGQIPQSHLMWFDAVLRFGNEEQMAFFSSEVLQGCRFGNAVAERGTKHNLDFRATVARDSDGTQRVNGTKYYSTGALTAQWIPVVARDERDALTLMLVRRDAAGVTVEQDWAAFGQRSTVSGTTNLADVHVEELQIIRGLDGLSRPSTFGAFGQVLHAAVDVGIAGNAFEDAVDFVRTRARPHFEAEVERASDEPHVILRFGALRTRLHAAEALLQRAGRLLDAAASKPTENRITEARLAVAEAKAFGGEVALAIATEALELSGASATDSKHNLDRHWRNARTHTLHDAARWKYVHAGNWVLNDKAPVPDNLLI